MVDFLIGGTAATCAGVFSNPFDVIKTRQQLEGELQKHVKHTKLPYGTQWQAIKTIVNSEGLVGLQKGTTEFSYIHRFPSANEIFDLFSILATHTHTHTN